jgi:hypothetical protein
VGKFDDKDGGEWAVPQSPWLLPAHYEFSPSMVARAIATRLLRLELPSQVRTQIEARLAFIAALELELARPRVVAERVLREDPELVTPPYLGLRRLLTVGYSRALELFRVG